MPAAPRSTFALTGRGPAQILNQYESGKGSPPNWGVERRTATRTKTLALEQYAWPSDVVLPISHRLRLWEGRSWPNPLRSDTALS